MINSPDAATAFPWDSTIPHAVIDGKTVTFRSTSQKFDALVTEWRRLRGDGSSTAALVNDAYGQIVAMGVQAVPFLLREIRNESGHWFSALKWITGISPVSIGTSGDLRTLRQAWLRWGIEHGYIETDSQG